MYSKANRKHCKICLPCINCRKFTKCFKFSLAEYRNIVVQNASKYIFVCVCVCVCGGGGGGGGKGCGLWPFQEYFTHIEPIVHQRWAKTREPGEKPPEHP